MIKITVLLTPNFNNNFLYSPDRIILLVISMTPFLRISPEVEKKGR